MIDRVKPTISYKVLRSLSSDSKRLSSQEIASKESVYFEDVTARKRALNFLRYLSRSIEITGKTVIDIGCGSGWLAIEIARRGARHVLGLDIDPNRIAAAREFAASENIENIEFECVDFITEYQPDQGADLVVSKAAFEHFPNPLSCLQKIYRALDQRGSLVALFGPLWGSPYGAHMQEFTKIPWVHFLFPEQVVLGVRNEVYRPDEHAERYEDIKGHLNRITVKRFRQFASEARFDIRLFRLNPAQDRGMYRIPNQIINSVPLLQEIGSMQVLAILQKKSTLAK